MWVTLADWVQSRWTHESEWVQFTHQAVLQQSVEEVERMDGERATSKPNKICLCSIWRQILVAKMPGGSEWTLYITLYARDLKTLVCLSFLDSGFRYRAVFGTFAKKVDIRDQLTILCSLWDSGTRLSIFRFRQTRINFCWFSMQIGWTVDDDVRSTHKVSLVKSMILLMRWWGQKDRLSYKTVQNYLKDCHFQFKFHCSSVLYMFCS